MGKKLHPSIQEFKSFVKEHPVLVQEVRKGKYSWQEIYEDWYLLGEDDEKWNKFKEKNSKKKESNKDDFIGKIFSTFKNVDVNDLQQQISNVGEAISTIQTVIHQFQSFKNPNSANTPHRQQPFVFRKD
ncbi:spore coat protein YlbD [Fredinandcohnia sp. 179-A 10B2 NHS]|uniref:spore coat protein YlbD n=1 Tax=Fredinandcohnia sp. 179-A 10B2 NHS TaxID=3235176 RepID=UPI00399F2F28